MAKSPEIHSRSEDGFTVYKSQDCEGRNRYVATKDREGVAVWPESSYFTHTNPNTALRQARNESERLTGRWF